MNVLNYKYFPPPKYKYIQLILGKSTFNYFQNVPLGVNFNYRAILYPDNQTKFLT